MLDNLINNLKKEVPFTDEEISMFLLHFDIRYYKKDDFIRLNGAICKELMYIDQGLVRCYTILEEKDITLGLWCEGSWFSDYESMFLKQPSRLYFQALEDANICTINTDALDDLYQKGYNFEKWGYLMSQSRLIKFLVNEKPEKLHTLEEHYQIYTAENTEIVKRAPLKYIASLLDIQPETLSRIRKRLATKPHE